MHHDDSKADCEADGGKLFRMETKEEYEVVKSFISKHEFLVTPADIIFPRDSLFSHTREKIAANLNASLNIRGLKSRIALWDLIKIAKTLGI